MGRFNQYLGKTEMTVDGKKLELDVKLKDMKAIMTSAKGKELDEAGIDKLVATFKDLMKRSEPDEPPEELDAFVDKNFLQFMTEFSIAMKWTTREEMKKSFREGGEPDKRGKKA